MKDKNLQLDRTVFFCDAVVAIAITLLALNIKIDRTQNGHLQFSDFLCEWKTFAAFLLSFINIAGFWRNHHNFFSYIKNMDDKLLWFNIAWLFFIILLPFSTSLVSAYFFDTPAVFTYSINTFFITIFQNQIWDYASMKRGFLREDNFNKEMIRRFRLYCNLDMVNALLAAVIALLGYPMLAFILLFTKLPMIVIVGLFHRHTFVTNRDKSGNKHQL